MRKTSAALLFGAILLGPAAASSQTKPPSPVPQTLSPSLHFTCDEFLRGLDSRPLQGRRQLTFTLFRGGDAWTPDSGLLLYGETAEVEVRNGQMTHAVGTGIPTFGGLSASVLAGAGKTADPEQVLWLQIAVAGEGAQTLLPRTRLSAVPLAAAAISAADSQRLGGLSADAYVKKSDLDQAAKAVVRLTGTGFNSFIGGGINNNASGEHSTIGAGVSNTASGYGSSILGGFLHQATRSFGSIGGGYSNLASGDYATVAGGNRNQAASLTASVGGGDRNAAQGPGSTIAGGFSNWATRLYSAIGGGSQNQAVGNYSAVPGGLLNSATGDFSFAAGRRAKATAPGAFAWADSQDANFVNSTPDSMRLRARNGVNVEANNRDGGLAFEIRNAGTGDGLRVVSAARAGSFLSSSGSALVVTGEGSAFGASISSDAGTGLVAQTGSTPPFPAILAGSDGLNGIGIRVDASNGTNAFAVWGVSTAGFAGFFNGRVHVQGTLTKSAGSFKIDHPLDPANKYLSHSFVESPDMKNVYDGTVVLGEAGRATVELPAYFEALNRDFRYQLTPIGAHAPLFVAEEIRENRFVIAGGTAGLKVSWQVTGIRKDAYAREHPIVVEEEKPAEEKGTYLNPGGHGQPESKSVTAAKEQAAGKEK